MSNCGNCSKQIFLTDPKILCQICNGKLHPTCLGIPEEAALILANANSQFIKASCSTCLNRPRNVETKIDDLIKMLSSLKMDFNDRISALEAKVGNMCTTTLTTDTNAKEEIIQESLERLQRANNLIIYGVPENTPTPNNSPANNDLQKVQEIISNITQDEGTPMKISSVIRFGKSLRNSDKPRPIKVQLPNPTVARKVLKNKAALKNGSFKNVSISDDKTPEQLKHLNNLREELKRRTSAGDTNLTIKYIKGIPKIIEKNSNKSQNDSLN